MCVCVCVQIEGWEGSFEAGWQKLRTQKVQKVKKGNEMAESSSTGRPAQPWP